MEGLEDDAEIRYNSEINNDQLEVTSQKFNSKIMLEASYGKEPV
jgi:hypothetical protein